MGYIVIHYRSRSWRVFLAFISILSLGQITLADLTPELLQAGKKATVLVEMSVAMHRKGYASAFCIDASGIFITNAHVTDSAVNGKLTLVLNPGEKDQQVLQATVLRSDKTMDLGVMKAASTGPIPVLEVGSDDGLVETMPLTAFGFPFGEALSMDKATYPAISVNGGRITSLRKKNGELELIQVDAALNPGNSGGPVLDNQGRIIGIVQAGVPGSGVNFVIPVRRLQKFLEKPEVALTPTSIPYDQRHAEREFSVSVISLARPRPKFSVTLSLMAGGDTRNFVAQSAAGSDTYTFKAIPVPAETGAKMVQITATYSTGSVTARLPDRSVSVAGKPMQLSAIRHISRSAGATTQPVQLTLADGQTATGPVTGLEAVKANVGEVLMTLDLTKASEVSIDDLSKPVGALSYTITVKLAGKDQTLATAQGSVELAGAPVRPAEPVASGGVASGAGSSPARPGEGSVVQGVLLPRTQADSELPDGAVRTEEIGLEGGSPYLKVDQGKRIVVGFSISIGHWSGHETIGHCNPLYGPPSDPTPRNTTISLAKDGYVVGGIIVNKVNGADGLQIIFMKMKGSSLDTSDSYLSPWFGDSEGSNRTELAGHGERVIGTYGRQGMNMNKIGLVVEPRPGNAPSADHPFPQPPPHPDRLAPGSVAPDATAEAGPPLNVISQFTLDAQKEGNSPHARKVIWAPNGLTIAGISDQGMQLWDMSAQGPLKGQKLELEHLNRRGSIPVAFSPDGKYLAAAGGDSILRLYSVGDAGLKLESTGVGHDRDIFSVAFSHDGKTILSGADDMAVLLWDVGDGKLQQRSMIKINQGVFGIKYMGVSSDDTRFTLSTGTGDVSIVDLVNGKPQLASHFKMEPGFFELPLAVSPATGQLLIGSQKAVHLWRGNNSNAWIAHEKTITAVAWSCDGQYFATTSEDGRLIVWDAGGKTRYSLERPSKFIDVKFAPANKTAAGTGLWVAALNDNGNIYMLCFDLPAAAKN